MQTCDKHMLRWTRVPHAHTSSPFTPTIAYGLAPQIRKNTAWIALRAQASPSPGILTDPKSFQARMSSRLRSASQVFVCAVTLAVFWIACVATVHLNELLVGAAAVAFAATFSIFVIRTLPLHFRPSLANLGEVWHAPWNIAVDTLVVTVVLACDLIGRRAPSLLRSAPWHRVAESGADTAARTLAVIYTTVSPNFIIVGIDCRRGQVLFHQVKKSELPIIIRHLDAKG